MRPVPVWDLATRLFHWLLVLFVLVCFVTGEEEGLVFAIHAYAGFLVLVLLAFRLGWGVVGSPHSLFSDFVYGWATVRRYGLSVLRFRPERFGGHNPLGGWMVIVMLSVLTAATLTGFLMVTAGAGWLEDIHEALGSFMQILVLVHIAGVLVDQFLFREKIVQAMITGRKTLPDERAQVETPLAGTWRALLLAGLVVAAGAYLFQLTDYAARVSDYAAEATGEKDD